MDNPAIIMLDVAGESDFPDNFHLLYHTHLYCQGGSLQFVFNDELMACSAGQFLFWFAESRLSDFRFLGRFRATVLLVAKHLLTDNIPDQGWGINAMLYSRTHPVKEIQTVKDQTTILTSFNRLYERFLDTEHHFYEAALKLQLQLFIFEMWNLFAKLYENRKHSLQTGTLYEQYMELLSDNCLQQREVQFYSDKLHITPKYLNYLCKSHSDVTASQWIQRYARERIIILLQNKRLNIAEIADEMEFSSRSFFTRYVKKLLGMTPSEYRSRLG